MTLREFEFNLVQIDIVIARSRKKFKLKEHQLVYDNLIALYDEIKIKRKNFDILKLRECSDKILDKVFLGIEFLHYNKWSQVPFHLTKCLEIALRDWIKTPDDFCIVFSNSSSSLNDFVARRYLHSDIKDTNLLCSALNLGVKYEHKLIQISQPGFYNKEFLSCIPTYHELGHFIESYYSIPFQIASSGNYFEYDIPGFKLLNNTTPKESELIFYYMREHFCDLFAAQYIGEVMIDYLRYIAEHHNYSGLHPSTMRRIEVIQTFLKGTGTAANMIIVDKLKETTKLQTRRAGFEQELVDRRQPLSSNPFLDDAPKKMSKDKEVHNLYIEGWKSFMSDQDFIQKYPSFTSRNNRINQLIKNSIDLTLFGRRFSTKLSSLWLN